MQNVKLRIHSLGKMRETSFSLPAEQPVHDSISHSLSKEVRRYRALNRADAEPKHKSEIYDASTATCGTIPKAQSPTLNSRSLPPLFRRKQIGYDLIDQKNA